MRRVFNLFILLLASLASFAQYVPKNGLIAYYPFDGNANDFSGNNYHMTVNGATLTFDRHSQPNKAYTFDGIDDIISCSTVLPLTVNCSWSFWVRIDTFQNAALIYNGNTNANGYGFSINAGINPTQGSFGDKITFFSGGINYNNSLSFQSDQWHHLVLTKNGTQFHLYVDNVLRDSSANSFNPPIGKFHVGLDYTNSTNPFNGEVDDIAIYDRVLTVEEIDTIFHGCGPHITVQPLSGTSTQGNSHTFYVASSTTPATYQWQMDSGTGFIDLPNAAPFSGVTTSMLTITNTSFSLQNNVFRAIVNNYINCYDTSDGATLNICASQILTQPTNLSVVEANTAKIFVTHLPGTVSYQWQMDAGTGFANLSNAGPFSGTNTDTLTISNSTTSLNNNDFRVILTNSASCSDTSIGVKLSVWPTGVDELQDQRVRLVYPNPSDGNFMLDLSNSSEGKVRLEIYDVSGRKVVMKDLDHFGSVIAVNTGIEQKGVFFLRLTSEGKTLLRQSIFIR